MRTAPLLVTSVASLLLWSPVVAQDDAATPPQVDESAAYVSMGYAMASQLRLNIGFSDEELDNLFEGMRLAATGGDEPENFKEGIQKAQQIYMTRLQDFQAQEQAKAAAVAEGNKAEAAAFFETLDGKDGVQKSDSGLYYEILEEGTGKAPAETDRVIVNYRGTLIDGREFDANEDAEFMVNRVVPGFSEGLQLCKEGGKIRLYIPSELGYGDRPARPGSVIEPGDALIFDVELTKVVNVPPPPTTRPPGPPPNMKPPPAPPTNPPSGVPPTPPPSGPPPMRPPTGARPTSAPGNG